MLISSSWCSRLKEIVTKPPRDLLDRLSGKNRYTSRQISIDVEEDLLPPSECVSELCHLLELIHNLGDLLRSIINRHRLENNFESHDKANQNTQISFPPKATIQIKNWKPLALDQVTEDKRATVGEVLGDISTFVTLRIRLYR